jgi:membrane dipeptidase
MIKKKNWDGYTSWSYLEPGIDYEKYPLEKQLNRFPEYDLGLTRDQLDRFEEFVEGNLIIDLHEHLNVFPKAGPFAPRNWHFLAYEGLAHSNLDAVFSNGGFNYPSADAAINFLGMCQCDMAHQDLLVPALETGDIMDAHEGGRIAVIHSFESFSCIGNNIDMIDLFFGLGLRACGLVFNQSNLLGTGLNEHEDGGLTDFGYDAVKRMNKTGIIIDVSHCSDLTALEAAEASDKPIIASHVGSRTLTDNMRMLPDDVLQLIAEKGGVIGVEAAGFAPRTEENPDSTIECTLDHIKYLIDLMGVDHVSGGPDTFYGNHALMYKEGGERSKPKPSYNRYRDPNLPELFDAYEMRAKTPKEHPHVQGLENPGEYVNIAKGLIRDGYSDNEIAKVMGLNTLRVIKACWPK